MEISEKGAEENLQCDNKKTNEILDENKQSPTETSKLDKEETKINLNDCDNKGDNNETTSESEVYQAFLLEFTRKEEKKIHILEAEKTKQIRIQFLYREKDQRTMEKFLLLVHQECKY